MTDTLKPLKTCPFCTGPAKTTGPQGVPGGECWVSCRSCGATSAMRGDIRSAIEAWNRRAP